MIKALTVCAALAGVIVTSSVRAQDAPPPSDQARRVEDLVNRAAALIDQKGRAAFDEFRKRDSQWWSGNTYLFAYDDHLNVLLNPAFPKREGTNPHGEKDARGKMFHDEFLKKVQTSQAGWVDYMFPKPGQTEPSHKWSYVKGFKADGMTGLIGAGFFAE
ncbi:cache domain-containing protein [Bradyrhizobium sp. STM 3557]|uniref:cache domain-containing protein n=1 Tax=Bradyrhizobium sp. STM 3557 TaxID=578920 RepID=UPI00388DE4DB